MIKSSGAQTLFFAGENTGPIEQKHSHFMIRTKEEMFKPLKLWDQV